MKITIDTSELRTLAVDMGEVADEIKREIPAVVAKGALNITNDMRDAMRSSASFGELAGGISYDLTREGFGAEIGPTKASRGGQSALGVGANIAYFGGANGGGGTVEDPQAALDREEPKFRKALLDLLDKAL